MSAKRTVVKVGSSSLTDMTGVLSHDKMECLVSQIAQIRSRGCHVVLVSSGAIAAGVGKLGWNRATCTLPEKQAASAVGQELLMSSYERMFAQYGMMVAQILLTRSDVEDRRRFVNIRNTMSTLLHHGIIPIVNENDTVAVDEIRFGDNDTLSSLVALLVEADILIVLTDIDGLYDANPKHDPSARRISEVWSITDEVERVAGQAGSVVGTGGMKTKVTAAKMATQAGIDVVIASSATDRVVERVVDGDSIGTRFHAAPNHLAAKKSWLAFGARVQGQIFMDAGAEQAICQQGSLLFPGITDVHGEFAEGDTVELLGCQGQVVGRGITNFSANDLQLLLIRRGVEPTDKSVHEVVHRDDLTVYL